MEKLEIAALSKIADILSDSVNSPVVPKEDIWKKIFYNSEQGAIFEDVSGQLRPVVERYGYDAGEENIYHNKKTYNALLHSFQELADDKNELVKLLNSIANKISLYRVLVSGFENRMNHDYPKSKGKYIDEYFITINNEIRNQIINTYSNKEFRKLKRNLNVLGLEIIWNEDEFIIVPFSNIGSEGDFELNIINLWLIEKYGDISESYTSARKAYGNGDCIGCITHCRSVITGMCSIKKNDGREWYSGLQKICNADKNISNLTNPKNISNIKYEVHSQDVNQRYQYPRFNMINKLYVMTCDLGAHNTEGNINVGDGVVDSEITTMEDALWVLRMTEDLLIWLFQTGNMNK